MSRAKALTGQRGRLWAVYYSPVTSTRWVAVLVSRRGTMEPCSARADWPNEFQHGIGGDFRRFGSWRGRWRCIGRDVGGDAGGGGGDGGGDDMIFNFK